MNIIKHERNPQPYLMLDTYPVHVPGLICPLPYLQDLHVHVYIYLTTGMYLCTCKTTVDLHEFVFTRGLTKTGGEEGMQSKEYIFTCPVVLHRFVDICQQVFGLFFLLMTQHVIYSQVYVIINGSVCGWGGGGGVGQLLPEGWHFICQGGGGVGEAGPPPPPPHPQGYA